MKMIRHIAYIPLIICLHTANIFSMELSTDDFSLKRLADITTEELNTIDDAANILISLQNRQNNEYTRVTLQKKTTARVSPKFSFKNSDKIFWRYAQSGNYEKVEDILNNPNERTLFPILSNAQAMFKIIFWLSTSKRESIEPSNDILLTLDILLSDKQIQDLLDNQLAARLLMHLTRKGNASRLDTFMKHDGLVAKISQEKAISAVAFLVKRGCNGMLRILLNNKKICSLLDRNSAIDALALSEEGQADKVRRTTLCTLLENDSIYELVKDLNLTQYLSTESLQYIHKKTNQKNVRLLIEKFLKKQHGR
jgi:hypothetical protein